MSDPLAMHGDILPIDSRDDQGIMAREELVLGGSPRVSPIPREDFSDEALVLTGRLRQMGSGRPQPTSMDEVPDIVGTMLLHPQVYAIQIEMGIQLSRDGSLPFRDRELVILRTGWLCQAPFEWGEHVKKAGEAGLTSDEIERVTLGSSAPGWSAHDAAILRGVEELHGQAMISDPTWKTLSMSFDDKQMIEFPILVGHYQSVAYTQNSLRLRLPQNNAGLKAR